MTQDHFSKLAAAYAKSRPTYPEALFDFLATLPARRERVWDCACGNGQASVALAERFQNVVATDLSEQQISQAISRENVIYRVATAEDSGIPAGSVDLITVAQAFHWLDFEKFFAEVRRVSRPGAVLALWAYGRHAIAPDIDPILEKYYAGIVGPYWPSDVKWVVEKYQTIPFPFAEIATPPLRMESKWNLDQMLGYWESWSSTQRFREAKGQDPIALILPELKKIWGPSENTKTVVWPLYLRVGRVHGQA